MTSFLHLLAALSFIFCTISSEENYKNARLYKITPSSSEEIEKLENILRTSFNLGLDIWKGAKSPGMDVEVVVPSKSSTAFEKRLSDDELSFSIESDDVEELLPKPEPKRRSDPRLIPLETLEDMSLHQYLRADEIYVLIRGLAKKYPERVSHQVIGHTYENRTIEILTISDKNRDSDKPIIFIDAGIHAREWLAPATALYAINQLVEHWEAHQEILKVFNVVILPLVNPDGYEFSHTSYRMWRKSLRPINSECSGVDLNRNFDYHWAEGGSSNDPCEDAYHGPNPFSEIETQILAEYLKTIKDKCKLYLSLHAYGRLLLHPWGYTEVSPSNDAQLKQLGEAGIQMAQRSIGTTYVVGSSSQVLYIAAGGSDDYALGVLGIPYAYTLELAEGGKTGFDPPPEDIPRFALEGWVVIEAMVDQLRKQV